MCLPSNPRVKASNDGVNTRRLTGWIPWPLQHTSTQISVDILFLSITMTQTERSLNTHRRPAMQERLAPLLSALSLFTFFSIRSITVRVNRHSGNLRGTARRGFQPNLAVAHTYARTHDVLVVSVRLMTCSQQFHVFIALVSCAFFCPLTPVYWRGYLLHFFAAWKPSLLFGDGNQRNMENQRCNWTLRYRAYLLTYVHILLTVILRTGGLHACMHMSTHKAKKEFVLFFLMQPILCMCVHLLHKCFTL